MKIAIFTRFNDNNNIIEFMKYHYSIGIHKIFIYNDGKSNIEKICKEHFPKNKDNDYKYLFDIFYYDWIKKNDIITLNTSNKFYESVIERIKEHNIDYLIHVDTDEYITLQKFDNINKLINHYKPFDQLYLNWVFFGDSNIYKVIYDKPINHKPINHKKDKTFLNLEPLLHINNMSDNKISSNDIKSIINLKTCISARNPHYFYKFNIKNPIIKDIFNNIQPLGPTIILKGPNGCEWKNESINELPCYLSHFVCITCSDFFNRRYHYKYGYRTSRLIEEYQHIPISTLNIKKFLKMHLKFIISSSLLSLSLEKIIEKINLNKDKFNECCVAGENILGNIVYNISCFYNSHNKNIIKNEHFNNFVKNNNNMYKQNVSIIPITNNITDDIIDDIIMPVEI